MIQKAVGGDPSMPNTVRFVGADGYAVGLRASTGRFTDVTAADGLPALPAGVSVPSGPFGFKVSGLKPGGAVAVTVALESPQSTSAYWRYGPPVVGGVAQWYRWDHDIATGTGAQLSGHSWILGFVDGYNGDDDGMANGTVVDPGGPTTGGVANRTVTRPSTATAQPVATTGTPTEQLLLIGWLPLIAGLGLCMVARRRPAR